MYPAAFDLETADSLQGALGRLERDNTRVLAGGHSMLPALKARSIDVSTLIDISDLDALHGIAYDPDTAETRIGAGTSYATIRADEGLRDRAPGLIEAVGSVGDRQIRNRGTIGGNLVQGDLGADIPASALAAGAEVTIQRATESRRVPVAELYTSQPAPEDHPVASIAPDELVTDVHIPNEDATSAYVRKTHPATGYALVGVAVSIHVSGKTVTSARIVASGLRRTPVVLSACADAIIDANVDDSDIADRAADASQFDPDQARDDPNVTGRYRVALLGSYVLRAVERAIERVGGAGQ